MRSRKRHSFNARLRAQPSHVQKPLHDQVRGVMGTRTGLGVKLHRRDLQSFVLESGQRLIVQVDVRGHAASGFDARGVDAKSVVLAGDLHPARLKSRTGWFAPRRPNPSLYVFTSADRATGGPNKPTMGFVPTTFLTSSTMASSAAGSPGPLLKNTKSLPSIQSSAVLSQGNTST